MLEWYGSPCRSLNKMYYCSNCAAHQVYCSFWDNFWDADVAVSAAWSPSLRVICALVCCKVHLSPHCICIKWRITQMIGRLHVNRGWLLVTFDFPGKILLLWRAGANVSITTWCGWLWSKHTQQWCQAVPEYTHVPKLAPCHLPKCKEKPMLANIINEVSLHRWLTE